MVIEIDFSSDEAIYMQLRNQIIMGIATRALCEGDALPSVRALADDIGVNMHTVNKAYALLRSEGFLKLDRRTGAVVALDLDHLNALNCAKRDLIVPLAEAACRGIDKDEIHALVEEIYSEYL
ncbi:MAG: GntR family transcriptional regulator [Eubacterium sp.]|nr:GntR family transcriptional regulator [Eubacterium sp.]